MDPAAHEAQTRRLALALERRGPGPGEAFPCPYLPGREARQLLVLPRPLAPGIYHSLMDLNFRRLGPVFYKPACDACAECRMIRLPVAEFRLSRAQRRCLARNRDVRVEVGAPEPGSEKLALYQRYLAARHDGQMDGSAHEFETFLYTSGVRTLELSYRVDGRLVAVGIADQEPLAMSAVYCYFEPAAQARSPGVFNVLTLIEECRRRGLAHLYLGYFVAGCRAMNYKTRYRPFELRQADGRWVRPTGPLA